MGEEWCQILDHDINCYLSQGTDYPGLSRTHTSGRMWYDIDLILGSPSSGSSGSSAPTTTGIHEVYTLEDQLYRVVIYLDEHGMIYVLIYMKSKSKNSTVKSTLDNIKYELYSLLKTLIFKSVLKVKIISYHLGTYLSIPIEQFIHYRFPSLTVGCLFIHPPRQLSVKSRSPDDRHIYLYKAHFYTTIVSTTPLSYRSSFLTLNSVGSYRTNQWATIKLATIGWFGKIKIKKVTLSDLSGIVKKYTNI